jgi:hypothetical protein
MRLRRREGEALEQLHLLLRVASDLVARRQAGHELPHAGAELEREVRCGGADEGVDVVAGGLERFVHGGP